MSEFTAVTQCPFCETAFLVGLSQLDQANGKVRCGNCLGIFHATKSMVVEQKNLFSMDGGVLNAAAIAEPILASSVDINTPKKTELSNNSPGRNEPLLTTKDVNDDSSNEFADLMNSSTSLRQNRHKQADHSSIRFPEPETSNIGTSNYDTKDSSTYGLDYGIDPYDMPPEEQEPYISPGEGVREIHDDMFDDIAAPVSPSVDKQPDPVTPETFTPEPLATSNASNRFFNSRRMMLVAISIAVLLIILQLIWLLSPAPNQDNSRLSCFFKDCTEVVDIKSLFSITGNVRLAQESEDILIADIDLHNRSNSTQPLPNIVISFTDVDGNVLAGREFPPKTYLNAGQQTSLTANQRLTMTLNFLHPGRDIDRFDLSVKPATN